ncbi:hypothetical protein ABT010_15220 [Streptomyces sp. NPDC002668]|uniref:hypothetical protein n=1 Tax=Streptomyces sp. NPDC002668 TaxID=3154422 RepID=UPI0033266B46
MMARGEPVLSSGSRLFGFYENLLAGIGLSEKEIKSYGLSELEEALERINDAISNPEQFGRVKLNAELGFVVAKSRDDSHLGILPLLLERKRLILNRIREVRSERNIVGLRDLVDQLPAGETKKALQDQLEDLEKGAVDVERQTRDTAQAQEEIQLRQARDLAMLKVEVMERRWAIWYRLLERESVATLVGSLLLVALVIVLTVAMFLKIGPSSILTNSFLIILGYFFGQNTERRSEGA